MKARLIYSHDGLKKPVLSEVIINTNAPINILEAKITSNQGEMVVDIPVNKKKFKEILQLFKKYGFTVKEIIKTIEINKNKCISCGACISPCPVYAIEQNHNWEVEFIEDKCTGCGICIESCPVRAIIRIG
jgi:Na+-translocating ferredoxin:NAD+ oxidoreductase RNF subunit RnfB